MMFTTQKFTFHEPNFISSIIIYINLWSILWTYCGFFSASFQTFDHSFLTDLYLSFEWQYKKWKYPYKFVNASENAAEECVTHPFTEC